MNRLSRTINEAKRLLEKGEAQEINADMIDDLILGVEDLWEQLAEASAASGFEEDALRVQVESLENQLALQRVRNAALEEIIHGSMPNGV